ncbi:MAG: hypothetical protein P8Z00_07345 [Anaerolineales bacterium]|jgi:hypothetical protein
MNKLTAVGSAAVGGLILYRCLPQETRNRLSVAVANHMAKHMKKMMANLPEDAPPRLVMSILPRLREQNDQIITMLQEQNELLREQKRTAQ